jgi:hypothetical protein
MTMFAALAGVLVAAAPVALATSPLAADDAAARLEAVQKWSKKQKKPQLSSKDAREKLKTTECLEVPAVKETGCEMPAKLCKLHEGDDGSSGTRVESLSLLMAGEEHDVKPLRVWWSAAYEAKVIDCDPPEHLLGHETDEQRVQAIAEWKKSHAKEYEKCVARLEKKAKADAEELVCDLVLVNGCRREAYVTCKTRNLRKGIAALEPLHRFEF